MKVGMKPIHGHCSGSLKNRMTPTYGCWLNMKARCHRPNHQEYKRYGAKGIRVCDAWFNSFRHFLADMGEKPEGLSIDRIDNSLGYFKENCRWATPAQQTRNRAISVRLKFNGQTKLLIEWAEELGIKHNTLTYRLLRGWTVERALTQPPQSHSGA